MDNRIGILFVALIITYSEQCEERHNSSQCRFDLVCVDVIVTYRNLNFFENQDYEYYDTTDERSEECLTRNLVVNGGQTFDRIYVNLRQTQLYTNASVPVSTDPEGEKIINVIYSLNLSSNKYRNTPVLRSMQNLVILDLSKNQLTRAVLSNENELQKLNEVDLSHNEINDIQVNEHPYTALKKINISHNYLVKIPDAVFAKMADLQMLDLSDNYIKELSAFTFEGIRNLLHLDLSNNRLSDMNSSLFRFTELRDLNLGNNRLRELKASDFEKLLKLVHLDLSYNSIKTIHNNAFQNMILLISLDLSYNDLVIANKSTFNSLVSLHDLLLSNNQLVEITQEYFHALSMLEYLDLSENAIARLESNSFNSMRNLTNLTISDNPLSGTLESGTFDGLMSLPSLDISLNLLTTLTNASFNDMNKLKKLNMSHCQIKELQYNLFVNTGHIELLDLSDNKLENVFLNTTELVNLRILLLNNNLIKTISSSSLYGLSNLRKLSLAYNSLEGNIHSESFSALVQLRFLDLSYNEKFCFTENLLDKLENLGTLYLSGIESNMHFTHIEEKTVSELVISEAGIHEIRALNLSTLTHVSTLVLRRNNVSRLNIGDFSGLSALENLDLSFNKISFIQHGVFSNNKLLLSLNISHNSLSVIGYGILRGLNQLHTLDMSYNNMKDLQLERFYEVKSLSTLIVDHNKIGTISVEEFGITNLKTLSIGDNHLSCSILVKLKKNWFPLVITAIRKDEHSGENVDGVTCNKDKGYEPTVSSTINNEKNDILMDMRNILYNFTTSNKKLMTDNEGSKLLFTDTCVGLILLILVCFVLYLFCNSKTFRINRFSCNNHELLDSTQNSNL